MYPPGLHLRCSPPPGSPTRESHARHLTAREAVARAEVPPAGGDCGSSTAPGRAQRPEGQDHQAVGKPRETIVFWGTTACPQGVKGVAHVASTLYTKPTSSSRTYQNKFDDDNAGMRYALHRAHHLTILQADPHLGAAILQPPNHRSFFGRSRLRSHAASSLLDAR